MKVQIAERLLNERKRLGLNQGEMAAKGGVAIRTYANYESGDRTPDAECLANLSQAGADVLYIVTGRIDGGKLEPVEMELVGGFRELDPRGRSGVLGMIAGYNAPEAQQAQTFHMGDVAQHISGGHVNQTGARISTGKRTKG